MQGVGPPLVTPFDESGAVDYDRLTDLVDHLEDGVDFFVPCGTTSEAPLLTPTERANVIEAVADATSAPVLAGTGAPGLKQSQNWTTAAADAGADAALVVTPFYYDHSQATLAEYYRELATTVDVPVYLYSVPSFTGTQLDPETVGELAEHPNIAGLKDSTGDYEAAVRTLDRVDDSFDVFVGSASILAQALAAGASGGVLALANLAPSPLAEIVDDANDPERTLAQNRPLVELNRAVTTEYGIPGLKYAMRSRGLPAGYARSPHRELGETGRKRIDELLVRIE
ncbi:dihydrodipicolinate synthase family protein [Halovenus halobia]|uniref:dihydrodipicolinate synthase family protein n=1 Tax=Halovenus halobia TaxID=3396622 RepID=UPI003F577240